MKILTETDKKYEEIELHVCNNALTDEVRAIVGELHEIYDYNIPGTDFPGSADPLLAPSAGTDDPDLSSVEFSDRRQCGSRWLQYHGNGAEDKWEKINL